MDVARRLVSKLPAADIETLVRAAFSGSEDVRSLRASSGSIAMQRACTEVLTCIGSGSGEFFAGALAGAAAARQSADRGPNLDVVWTGPHSAVTTSRLTSAVVVSLLAEAHEEIILVSYATHSDKTLTDALTAAARRGVEILLLLESNAENPNYTNYSAPFPNLDAQRLTWPATQRESGAALHAKILLIDSDIALVGSANFTQRAMEINLECGMLIRGGNHPASIRAHILSLRRQGILQNNY
ncbi:hypothetical protein HUT06_42760 [Actinomadura sp. NAK00032]|uniref:DISARM system phospholipase D-like protein DrmC n=1 Tax=Actinomadura sp. NAK00032 TaxID=2742128 RepID=UPI0015907449|nr:DISARM system phospholipase D-like protein DrmC [Actinomadura sp. NAK00032]QKW39931.1 hypothetical protein HUT06_42760 [Actinomadura sp. NAK00032]